MRRRLSHQIEPQERDIRLKVVGTCGNLKARKYGIQTGGTCSDRQPLIRGMGTWSWWHEDVSNARFKV